MTRFSRSLVAGLAGLITSTSAQDVVSVFLPGFDSMPLVGSVVSTVASNTVLAIACPPGTDSSDCGILGDITVTFGPSTLAFTTEVPAAWLDDSTATGTFTLATSCSVSGTVTAICSGTPVPEAGIPATAEYSEGDITFFPVTLTDDFSFAASQEALLSSEFAAATATAVNAPSVTGGDSSATPSASVSSESALETGSDSSSVSPVVSSVVTSGVTSDVSSVVSTKSPSGSVSSAGSSTSAATTAATTGAAGLAAAPQVAVGVGAIVIVAAALL